MKKIVFACFMVAGCVGFAQQKVELSKTQYNYTVLNVDNEQLLQQAVDEISAYKSVSDCKYRMKVEKKTAEITYTFIERPRKGEGDVGNPPPNTKKILLDKGLQYSGFTFNTEKITE